MPAYSLAQLIQRANAGNIGTRGLKRLQSAGVEQGSIAHQGLAANQLGVDPSADLNARRAALYGHALQAAHDLQPGQTLSAGLQRRLQLGGGGMAQPNTITPHSASEVGAFQGDNYNALLDAIKKRSQGIASTAGIYR